MSTIDDASSQNAEQDLTAMRANVADKIHEAERTAYAYFCACPLGPERDRAFDVYENVRTAMRVG